MNQGLPRWLVSRPFLLADALRWVNLHRRYRALLPSVLVLLLACGAILALPAVGRMLEIAAAYPFAPFVGLTGTFAMSTVRRKATVYRSLVDSWLAPLAAPSSTFLRVSLVPLLQLAVSLFAVVIPLLAGSLTQTAAMTLLLADAAAFVAGSLIGWLSGQQSGVSAPDFHHVAVRRIRDNWARSPKLEPLSYWAMAQTKVLTKPKVTASAMVFVLMAIPMGASGQTAVAIVAAAWVVLYLFCLSLAAARVAFRAAWWLAPTTIRYSSFTRFLSYRMLLAQVWTFVCVLFLIYADGLRGPFQSALRLSVLWLLLSVAVTAGACWSSMRSVGMRAS